MSDKKYSEYYTPEDESSMGLAQNQVVEAPTPVQAKPKAKSMARVGADGVYELNIAGIPDDELPGVEIEAFDTAQSDTSMAPEGKLPAGWKPPVRPGMTFKSDAEISESHMSPAGATGAYKGLDQFLGGYLDEAIAGVQSATGPQTFKDSLSDLEKAQQMAAAQRPVESGVGAMAGAGGQMFLLNALMPGAGLAGGGVGGLGKAALQSAPQAASAMQKARAVASAVAPMLGKRAAATGALGAVNASGNTSGSLTDRAKAGGKGFLTGAGMSVVADGAGAGVGAVKNAFTKVPGAAASAAPAAAEEALNIVDDAGNLVTDAAGNFQTIPGISLADDALAAAPPAADKTSQAVWNTHHALANSGAYGLALGGTGAAADYALGTEGHPLAKTGSAIGSALGAYQGLRGGGGKLAPKGLRRPVNEAIEWGGTKAMPFAEKLVADKFLRGASIVHTNDGAVARQEIYDQSLARAKAAARAVALTRGEPAGNAAMAEQQKHDPNLIEALERGDAEQFGE